MGRKMAKLNVGCFLKGIGLFAADLVIVALLWAFTSQSIYAAPSVLNWLLFLLLCGPVVSLVIYCIWYTVNAMKDEKHKNSQRLLQMPAIILSFLLIVLVGVVVLLLCNPNISGTLVMNLMGMWVPTAASILLAYTFCRPY